MLARGPDLPACLGFDDSCLVVNAQPEPCKAAIGLRHKQVAGGCSVDLHGIKVEARVEVEVHPKHVARAQVRRRDGLQHDVATVLAIAPIDRERLPVGRKIELRKNHLLKLPLPTRREREALAMDEGELVVERLRAQTGHLGHAPERHLVDEQRKDLAVLVRHALPLRGSASTGESLPA